MFTSLLRLILPFPLLASLAAAQDAIPEGVAGSDWTSIRAAYDAGRHAVHQNECGFTAANPGQGWRLSFDTRGFLVEPTASNWSWGLELVSYGFEGSELFVGDSACASSEGGRVAYAWNDGIEEWYVNDTRGFEHGFTVHERPQGGASDGQLKLELRVRGDLAPRVHAGRHAVSFLAQDGAAVLNYSGLTVFDATGTTLDAWFEESAAGLRLSVDERGATYPLTIDPIVQEAYLKASNTDAFDRLGVSVCVSGDTLVVGAIFESGNATGVNGDESNNSALRSGAAYVFTRSGTNWSQQAYLKASNTDYDDRFGTSVSISGDSIVVGALQESSNATGVNGIESDNSANSAGAAYVFTRNGTSWVNKRISKPPPQTPPTYSVFQSVSRATPS